MTPSTAMAASTASATIQDHAGPNGIVVNLAAGSVDRPGRGRQPRSIGSDRCRSIESVRRSKRQRHLRRRRHSSTSATPAASSAATRATSTIRGHRRQRPDRRQRQYPLSRTTARSAITADVMMTIRPIPGSAPPPDLMPATLNGRVHRRRQFPRIELQGDIQRLQQRLEHRLRRAVRRLGGRRLHQRPRRGLDTRALRCQQRRAPMDADHHLGLSFDMDAGVVSGLNASATFSYGTSTPSSVEMIRGTNLDDVDHVDRLQRSERQRGQPGHLQRVRRWRRHDV